MAQIEAFLRSLEETVELLEMLVGDWTPVT
jgi:hypothetical protein